MTYALDTNAISYAIRGEGAVGRRLLAVSPNEIVIPSIAMYEILNWRNAPKTAKTLRAKIDAFLAPLAMAHFDEAVARHASSVYLALAARGALIGALDILIAGTALAHSAVLVTRNVRDLSRVPDLKVEDWYAC